MKAITLDQLPQEGVSHNPQIRKRVMLRRGELPHLANFSQARFAPGDVANAHAHNNMWEVFFVESGQGVIRVDGREQPLTAGVCVLIEPGERHEVANTGTVDLVITYFGINA